jgi:RHS repeat-associated protein
LKHSNYNADKKQWSKFELVAHEPHNELVAHAENVTSKTVLKEVVSIEYKYQYKYNGKEFQDELGLNVYDYGARKYDPSLARWLSMDALSEKYETLSPYNYVSNNPVNAIDPDGRLIVYVNGLLFSQALSMKLTSNNYRPERWGTQIQTNGLSWKGKALDYWGEADNQSSVRYQINSFFGDEKNVFVNGSHHFRSQASERFEMGRKAGNELIAQLQNGTIALDDTIGETIKIVGHSQGAAHAAGMLTQLLDSEYANRLEAGIYLSSHQPGGFSHPDGIPGMQFSTKTDRVSSRAGVLGHLMQLFNGSSELKEIEGSDFLMIRPEHKGGKGGHNVETWTSMDDLLQQAYDFLNKK